MTRPRLHIAAALLHDGRGRMLVVRKRGTACFMQPGGKIAPGEDTQAALLRELDEELGLRLTRSALRPLGRFTAPAAHEPDHDVEAALFAARCDAPVAARAEIDALAWIAADDRRTPLAPLTRDHILPLLANFEAAR